LLELKKTVDLLLYVFWGGLGEHWVKGEKKVRCATFSSGCSSYKKETKKRFCQSKLEGDRYDDEPAPLGGNRGKGGRAKE